MSEYQKGRAWIELSQSALHHNVAFLRHRLPERCALMPAVKADAYGHGAVLITKELEKLGVNSFCVACVAEGVSLRTQGVKGEILVLGYTHPEQFSLLEQYNLTQTVIDHTYATELNHYNGKIHVHIGIDTGMHRLGERSDNIQQLCAICEMKNLIVDGLFTHLSADDTLSPQNRTFTDTQTKTFYKVIETLKKRGYPCPKIHLQSSYGVLHYPELAEDYARVGIALYGVLSTKEDTSNWSKYLQPVLSLKARIATVKPLYAGESAGYGMQFKAEHDMQIATLTIGYADGLPRALSCGNGSVLINGHKAPIIGCICMDQTIVDVSSIPNVAPGDTAVLIGSSGTQAISACDWTQQCGTITNEILSRLGARLERVMTA
ncbi:MAG: serine racemase VanT catalytic subunit [Oscillospiraceae bacterium]|jgi:serine/alanine racemase